MTYEEALEYGPVLERMVELLGQEGSRETFGTALERAQREVGVMVPEEYQSAVITAAFKIIMHGGIPGAPEA